MSVAWSSSRACPRGVCGGVVLRFAYRGPNAQPKLLVNPLRTFCYTRCVHPPVSFRSRQPSPTPQGGDCDGAWSVYAPRDAPNSPCNSCHREPRAHASSNRPTLALISHSPVLRRVVCTVTRQRHFIRALHCKSQVAKFEAIRHVILGPAHDPLSVRLRRRLTTSGLITDLELEHGCLRAPNSSRTVGRCRDER